MKIIGIDAGNSRMKVAYPDATGAPQILQNRLGEPYTISAVYFPRGGGEPVVGTEALNMAWAEPDRVVLNWKRAMGTDKVLFQDETGKQYRAKDILEILLKNIKEDVLARLGEDVRECAICVPANYNDVQKEQTKSAGEHVGTEVLLLVPEPTAAALGNGLHQRGSATSLIFDLGGGTFDVSIVQNRGNVFDVVTTNGEPHLGGQDFTNRLKEKALDMFVEEHGWRPTREQHPLFLQELADRVESLKISLSAKERASLVVRCDGALLNRQITRSDFEAWTCDLKDKTIERTMKTIEDAGLKVTEVDGVYAVGGASLMPMIPDALEKALGKKPAQYCEPHFAAACGAVVAARIECHRRNKPFVVNGVALPPPDIYLRDIISHPIGVCVVTDDHKLVCHEILSKGTQIPSRQIKTFKLEVPNQTEALIEVLQGKEGQPRESATLLGHFDLKGLPARADMAERIEVELNLDSSGLLAAAARDRESGITAQLEIEYKKKGDSQEDVA